MLLTILSFCLSGILAVVIFPSFVALAKSLGWVDHPDLGRKKHKQSTPVIGGVVIGFTVVVVFSLISLFSSFTNLFYYMTMGLFVLFLIVGAIDDRVDIPAKHKFIFQILCAVLVVKSGVSLASLNLILDLDLPMWLMDGLVVFIIVGAMNAYNLIDGVDGLLGGFLLFGFGWLLVVAVYLQEIQMTWLLVSVIAGLLVFLNYNFSKAKKVFMGDAGALSLGFLLIVLSITLFDKSTAASNEINWIGMGIVSVLSVPVFDTIIVFARRLNKFKSPFQADRTHLHHLVQKIFSNHKIVSSVILSYSALMVVMVLFFSYLGWKLFAFVLLPILILVFYIFIQKVQLYQKSKMIINQLEKYE